MPQAEFARPTAGEQALRPNPNTIGNWDTARLLRFVKQIISDEPPSNIPALEVSELTVLDKLKVEDESEWIENFDFHTVGATGEPALANSWANTGSPWNVAGFMLDHFGYVHLRGRIDSGTVGSAAFTLPPGYRPEQQIGLVCISNAAVGLVVIETDGDVIPTAPSNNTYVSLDGLQFKIKVS